MSVHGMSLPRVGSASCIVGTLQREISAARHGSTVLGASYYCATQSPCQFMCSDTLTLLHNYTYICSVSNYLPIFICLSIYTHTHTHTHTHTGSQSCCKLCSFCQRCDFLGGASDGGQPVSHGAEQVLAEPLCSLLHRPCKLCDSAVRRPRSTLQRPHPICYQATHAGRF